MTKAQRRDHKKGNARRRDALLKGSLGKKKGDNRLIFLGGVGQKSKYSKV